MKQLHNTMPERRPRTSTLRQVQIPGIRHCLYRTSHTNRLNKAPGPAALVMFSSACLGELNCLQCKTDWCTRALRDGPCYRIHFSPLLTDIAQMIGLTM